MNLLKIIWIYILVLFCINTKASNPENWFDTQYTDAINFCSKNQELIHKSLSRSSLPSQVALSIAFPEMLRYTLWKDLFETTALELIYVHGGKTAADFSIGWLQMKPSFAENIEKKVRSDSVLFNKYPELISYTLNNNDTVGIRRERIIRLKQFQWQLIYLSAFIDFKYAVLKSAQINDNEMLKYMAAWYNRGMDTNINELEDFWLLKTFPYGPRRSNPFGFVEVAEYFYNNNAMNIINNPLNL